MSKKNTKKKNLSNISTANQDKSILKALSQPRQRQLFDYMKQNNLNRLGITQNNINSQTIKPLSPQNNHISTENKTITSFNPIKILLRALLINQNKF